MAAALYSTHPSICLQCNVKTGIIISTKDSLVFSIIMFTTIIRIKVCRQNIYKSDIPKVVSSSVAEDVCSLL